MDKIWKNVDWEWSDTSPPSKEAIELATRLLRRLDRDNLLPGASSKGYLPTVRLFWRATEIEVHNAFYELYPDQELGTEEPFPVIEFGTDPNSIEKLIEALSNDLSAKID